MTLREQFEKEGHCYEYNGEYTAWLETKLKIAVDALEKAETEMYGCMDWKSDNPHREVIKEINEALQKIQGK